MRLFFRKNRYAVTTVMRVLSALAFMVCMATGAGAREMSLLSAADAGSWTKYDWNASAGKGGSARFEVEKQGKAALLHIVAETPDDARFVRQLTVEPDTIYRFSCTLRTEDVGSAGRGAGISVSGILEGSPDVRGTSGWKKVEFYGKTVRDQSALSLTVGIGGYGSLNSGIAWFRTIGVEKVASAPPGVKVVSLAPAPVAAPSPQGGKSRFGGLVLALIVVVGAALLLAGMWLRRSGATASGPEKRAAAVAPPLPSAAVPEMADYCVMAAMTIVVLVISLWNLGGHKAPDTGWQAAQAGEYVTVDFGKKVDLSRIYYYCGINERTFDGSRFTLSARDAKGRFAPVVSFVKNDSGIWKYEEVHVRTDAVRITADSPGGRINELAFVEKGSRVPLKGLRIGESKVLPRDIGTPQDLIDEQSAFEYTPSFRTGFYFDEIYHGRSAWEMLHGIEPYETTHPPLGKMIISWGIAIFGMNAFGWRVAGAFFGTLLVPLMYLFGLKLFRDRFYAFCAAFLMAFDFMRFAQSRLAVIDVFAVFFIILMYYFILDLFPAKGDDQSTKLSMRPLFLAGITFGIGAACKWIAVYAGGGLVLLVLARLLSDFSRGDQPEGHTPIGFLGRRIAVCIVSFGVIPAIIYLLAYIPYMQLPGPGHDLAGVVGLQEHMLNYHRTLVATHPFSSQWWSWPLDLKPMWMYSGSDLPEGLVSSIASFGNPAIWWLTIPAVISAAVLAIRRRDARMGVVLVAFLFQYLPWVGIARLVFIYHFFSAIPFVILCIVEVLRTLESRFPRFRIAVWCYLGLVAALFVLFYPVLSGMTVPAGYVAGLKWLPTWIF